MRIACVQLAIEGGDVEANVSRAVDRIHAAADRNADLVVLPELFNIGHFAFDEYPRDAEPLDNPSLTRVQTAAIERDVALVAGSIVEDLAGRKAARPTRGRHTRAYCSTAMASG